MGSGTGKPMCEDGAPKRVRGRPNGTAVGPSACNHVVPTFPGTQPSPCPVKARSVRRQRWRPQRPGLFCLAFLPFSKSSLALLRGDGGGGVRGVFVGSEEGCSWQPPGPQRDCQAHGPFKFSRTAGFLLPMTTKAPTGPTPWLGSLHTKSSSLTSNLHSCLLVPWWLDPKPLSPHCSA